MQRPSNTRMCNLLGAQVAALCRQLLCQAPRLACSRMFGPTLGKTAHGVARLHDLRSSEHLVAVQTLWTEAIKAGKKARGGPR